MPSVTHTDAAHSTSCPLYSSRAHASVAPPRTHLRYPLANNQLQPSLMDAEMQKTPCYETRWWSEETVAVVTGANKGIGLEIVRRLAELGVTVVLTSRDVGRGLAAAEQLRDRGLFRVEFCRLDVAEEASIDAFVTWLRRKFGFLDILVIAVT
ncbi:hypothetical protein Taro_019498 [Colocasia esculenta]|uniref:Uncharacterized protein n=1 Tax=Colocasia esculenta TaxID=4460 RepID=A0A843UTY2_COLES|nr:hypothetical protein [Colocasia esculenta]